ncbi:putative mediator of RNA polymerase II transcription subunit 29 [Drosophila tropicalis]|uniref:putative mediator of RNA polymerase II transcription subunit 29 n=1 Tax=Drosophila tropicalis TaxID=46794 RepID=UPI0035ABB3C5
MLIQHFNSLPWLLLGVLLLAALMLQSVGAEEETENASTESNEIIPREAIQKLDFSVRQALLRAIDKLEQEEAAESAKTKSTESQHMESTTLATISSREKEEILEESTNEAETEPVVPTVQFYTATFDERNAQEQLLSSFIDRSKVWKKTTLRKQSSPILPLEGETGPDNKQLARSVDSASGKSGSGSGSLSSNEISHDGSQEIKFEIRSSNAKSTTTTTTTTSTTTTTTTPRPRTTRRRPTTTTTTTTTTPRPTHNEDGENIELVDKQDIRIQEAPLVTAFTVDLDERGTAQKFRPLNLPNGGQSRPLAYHHIGPTITKLSVLESEPPATPLPTQNPATSSTTQITTSTSNGFSTTPALLASSSSTTSNYVKEPLTNLDAPPSVNNYLIERHRALEQQIYQLKLQAQQQQALILRQLKLLEEQTQSRFQAAAPIAQQQQQLPSPQAQQQQQQQQHGSLEAIQTALQPPSPGYSIRPSVEFIPSTHTKTIIYPTYPIEQQQLPLRDAVAGHKFALQGSSSHNNNNNYQKLPTPTNAVQQIFQNLQQNLQKANENANNNNNVHIQPSNQFNFAPGEASPLQALPQHNYQQFQPQQQQQLLLPSYVTNALYQQQQQQQQRARHFRQETGTGNFGLNSNVEIQPSNSFATTIVSQQPASSSNLENQNFYRQHLTPQLSSRLQQNAQQYLQQQQQQQQLQLQQQQQPNGANDVTPTLNHGIPQFSPQKLHFNGSF